MTEIRDAATVILVRDPAIQPRILMGQRGSRAVFMPNMFVFPGGAVDAADHDIPLSAPLSETNAMRLSENSGPTRPDVFAISAIRELFEETGLVLGEPGSWAGRAPTDWVDFASTGHIPRADMLHFVFRAITPPGRPRRFDARFFLADANAVSGDLDDFSRASDELSHLQWVRLEDIRGYQLPFITQVVIAEIARALPTIGAPETVPFFKNDDEESLFLQLGSKGPLDAE